MKSIGVLTAKLSGVSITVAIEVSMIEIKIDTEEDLCGDEFLATGELKVSNYGDFWDLVELNHNGHKIHVSRRQLLKALKVLDYERNGDELSEA